MAFDVGWRSKRNVEWGFVQAAAGKRCRDSHLRMIDLPRACYYRE